MRAHDDTHDFPNTFLSHAIFICGSDWVRTRRYQCRCENWLLTFPKRRGLPACRATEEACLWSGAQAGGDSLFQSFGLSAEKARQGRVIGLVMARLNNSGKFWAIEVVPSLLIPGPGMTEGRDWLTVWEVERTAELFPFGSILCKPERIILYT